MKFNLLALLTMVAGIGLGLEMYRVTRDNQLPPIPKYTEGIYVETLPIEIDANGFSEVYEIISVQLHGSPGNWYYDYSIQREHGRSRTSGNGRVGQLAIDVNNTENQELLSQKYRDYYDFCEKERKEQEALRKANKTRKEGDGMAAKALWSGHSKV